MDLAPLVRGVVLGFSIAAPVGPIGVLCIQRTLTRGRLVGFISGLGAASADACYGVIAAFGLALLSDRLVAQQRWLEIIGGLFVCVLGVRTLLTQPGVTEAPARSGFGLLGAYGSTLALTLTNPLTILSFVAIFAGLGVPQSGGAALALVIGVFCGSALWWLTLSSGVGLIRERFGLSARRWINRLSGLVLIGFGLLILLR